MRSDGVVIVGGGLAAQRCAETLRARGYEAPVRIVCAEPEPPYDRPAALQGAPGGHRRGGRSRRVPPDGWYEDHDVELILGARAHRARPRRERRSSSTTGSALGYEKLLIATGSRARRLPDLEGWPNVHYLRTLADARRLRDVLRPGASLVVVGAGFIGQEVAATARRLGVDVTIVEALPAPLISILGEDVGRWFVDLHRSEGVEVLLSARLARARGNGSVEELVLEDGRRLDCDAVVVGIGVAPAAEWLAAAGSSPMACSPTPRGGPRSPTSSPPATWPARSTRDSALHTRTEHWDAAARQGAAAAKAMLGADPGPVPLPELLERSVRASRSSTSATPSMPTRANSSAIRDGRDFGSSTRATSGRSAALAVDQPAGPDRAAPRDRAVATMATDITDKETDP